MDILGPIIASVCSSIDSYGYVSAAIVAELPGVQQDIVRLVEDALQESSDIGEDWDSVYKAFYNANKLLPGETVWSYIARFLRGRIVLQKLSPSSDRAGRALKKAWGVCLQAAWSITSFVRSASLDRSRQRGTEPENEDEGYSGDFELISCMVCLLSVIDTTCVVLATMRCFKDQQQYFSEEMTAETVAVLSLMYSLQSKRQFNTAEFVSSVSPHEVSFSLVEDQHTQTITSAANAHSSTLTTFDPSPFGRSVVGFPWVLQSIFTDIHVLTSLCDKLQEQTLLLLKSQIHSSVAAKRRDAVESIVTQALAAIVQHWKHDSAKRSVSTISLDITSELTSIHAVHWLLQTQGSERWVQELQLPSRVVQLTTSGVVTIVPLAQRLLTNHVEAVQLLGSDLLYTAAVRCNTSSLLAVADWIARDILLAAQISTSAEARLVLQRLLLGMCLCGMIKQSSATAPTAVSANATVMTQLAGEFFESSLSAIGREFDWRAVWVRWLCLLPSLAALPAQLLQYFQSGALQALLHSLNVWHLGLQMFILTDVWPLLVRRTPKDTEKGTVKFLTELVRMYIFYSRNTVPDLSQATSADRIRITQKLTQLWEDVHQRCPEECRQWRRETEAEIDRQLASTNCSREHKKSIKLLQSCVKQLSASLRDGSL